VLELFFVENENDSSQTLEFGWNQLNVQWKQIKSWRQLHSVTCWLTLWTRASWNILCVWKNSYF